MEKCSLKISRNGSYLQGSDKDERAAAAKDSYAAALAWAQLAERYGYGPEIDLRENQKRIEQEARELKEQIRWSPEFVTVVEETSLSSLLNMAEPQHDQSQQNTEVRPVTQFKEYLNLRGKKVRDHQYGRERFDAVMKGLATVMEPQEFGDFCEQINASRKALDKNNKALVSAKDYMAPEKYQQLEKEQKKTEPVKTEPVKTGQEPQDMVL